MSQNQDLQSPLTQQDGPAQECAAFFNKERQARLSQEMVFESFHRLKKVALELGLEGENDLIQHALKGNMKSIAAIESLLLRAHPSFFEGAGMYKAFENTLLPQLINQNSSQKKISIWVPGCAEGCEAYSLALLLNAHRTELAEWKLHIHATDTNNLSLQQAETAAFDTDLIDDIIFGLYGQGLKKNGDEYMIRSEVRELITFQYNNFYDSELPKEAYDVIVFRNQLKYWTPDLQEKIIKNFEKSLQPHGYLILGYGESLLSLSSHFKIFANTQGFYQKLM
tara:strand:+ start:2572 stop:3414 length:843 start_codon:yes stop_codon:yes gene_type:complete